MAPSKSKFHLYPFDANRDPKHQEKLDHKNVKHGMYSGKYTVNADDGSIFNIYLKKNPHEDKNICEVFASHFMRFIAEEVGEDPDLIAEVDYVDTEKDGVYIGSKIFDGYHDLYLDAYLAFHAPSYEPLRAQVGNKWQTIPPKRPSYLEQNPYINTIILSGRYKKLAPCLAFRAIIDDPDLHYKNIGAVPIERSGPDDFIPVLINGVMQNYCLSKTAPNIIDSTITIDGDTYYKYELTVGPEDCKELCIEINGLHYLIPNVKNTRVVGIDFDGAFGDFRLFKKRGFDGEIHTNYLKNFLRYYPSFSEPPAYNNQLPEAIKDGDEFFKTLARYSQISKAKIKDKIDQQVDQIFEYYANEEEIIEKFAARIGANIDPECELRESIVQHLYTNFLARQEHSKKLFLEYFCRLSLKEQKLLLESYQNEEELCDKELMVFNLIQELKLKKRAFFHLLEKIETSDSEFDEISKKSYQPLKYLLHDRLCKSIIEDTFTDESEDIRHILKETDRLMLRYRHSQTLLNDSKASQQTKLKAVRQLVDSASYYEDQCIRPSNNKKIIQAGCILLGAIVGFTLGAILGFTLGSMIGAVIGSSAPVLGNIAGALSAGSIGGVIVALKGASLGVGIGAALSGLMVGSANAYLCSQGSRYFLFNHTDKTVKKFQHNLVQESKNQYRKAKESTEEELNSENMPDGLRK